MLNSKFQKLTYCLPGIVPGCLRTQAQRGFTLIESMVVVAIAAVLMSLAAPAVGAFRTKLEVRTLADSLHRNLLFTRSEAIMRNNKVVMCKSSNGKQCTTSGGWEQGWIVFQDTDADTVVDSDADGNPTEPVLLVQPATSLVRVVAVDSLKNRIAFNSIGLGSALGSLTVCTTSSSPVAPRKITVSAGRPRVETLLMDTPLTQDPCA